MAKRHTEIILPRTRTEAYDETREALLRQGWVITKATPPTWLPLHPGLWVRGGPAQVGGTGFTRVRFPNRRSEETRVCVDTCCALSDDRAVAPALSLAEGLGIEPQAIGLDPKASSLPGRAERNAIRILVAFVIAAAILTCLLVSRPDDLPGPTFNLVGLYRIEIALVVFYGGLLLLTPVFSGVVRGRLPIEISARGAKFAEEIRQERAEISDKAIASQQEETARLTRELVEARVEINKMQSAPR
jgi:hypothetical protein